MSNMTEEIQKNSETTEEEKKEVDAASNDQGNKGSDTEAAGEDSDLNKEIDYAVELEKEKAARKIAEEALAKKRFKESEDKRKNVDNDSSEKPLTANELQAILAAERDANRKEILAERIDKIASSISKSEAEKNLYIEIHKNRVFPNTLSLEEQFEEVYVIANRKKLIGDRNEAFRSLKNKIIVNNNVADTQHDAPKVGEPKLPPQDAAEYARLGFVFNSTNRRYEKKLANGKLLVKDPVSKQTFIAK